VVLFRESCTDRLTQIEQALGTHSASEIASHAHALKGSLGMFASRKSIDVIEKLENEALVGNYESVRRLLETLRHAIDCLEPTLDRLTLEHDGSSSVGRELVGRQS
jgi:HPt (histidine-containing phosphotransfer) domain-containing protein